MAGEVGRVRFRLVEAQQGRHGVLRYGAVSSVMAMQDMVRQVRRVGARCVLVWYGEVRQARQGRKEVKTLIYDWKRAMPVKAQDAGEHLKKLERQHGAVTPKLIVDDARPKTALLHKCFEWNDGIAAEKYRESQAGFILRNLVTVSVTKTEEQSEVRAFVNIIKEGDSKFISVTTAMSDDDMRQQVLNNALSELMAFKKKYGQLEELAEVFTAVSNLGA